MLARTARAVATPIARCLGTVPAPHLHKIAITGGPCAGKTSAFPLVRERLESHGFAVYVVPEAATMMMTAGASWSGLDVGGVADMQCELMRLQMSLEDTMENAARVSSAASGLPAVLLCDRGLLDSKAYTDPPLWEGTLESLGLEEADCHDRYSAVVHMVTAAVGAGDFYTTANNAARRETAEEAAAVDTRTREAWLGHPQLRVIDNSGDGFSVKLDRTVTAICHKIGIPRPAATRKYFAVDTPHEAWLPPGAVEFDVTHTYLTEGRTRPSLRLQRRKLRGMGGARGAKSASDSALAQRATSYLVRERRGGQEGDGMRAEVFRTLTARQYSAMARQRDPGRCNVARRRRHFIWGDRHWEWDVVREPASHAGMTVLSTEVESEEEGVVLPPAFTGALEGVPPPRQQPVDVTADPAFLTATLSWSGQEEER